MKGVPRVVEPLGREIRYPIRTGDQRRGRRCWAGGAGCLGPGWFVIRHAILAGGGEAREREVN